MKDNVFVSPKLLFKIFHLLVKLFNFVVCNKDTT